MSTTAAASAAEEIQSIAERKVHSIQAVNRLAMHREKFPDLVRAQAEARLDLAAAIMTLDEIEEEGEDQPGYNALLMMASMEIERLKDVYSQTLADLLRGYKS